MKNSKSSWRSFARIQEEERFKLEQEPSYTKPRVNTYIQNIYFDPALCTIKDKSEYVESIDADGRYISSIVVYPQQEGSFPKLKTIKNYKQFLIVFGNYTKVRYSKRRGYRGRDKKGNLRYGL